MDWTIVWAFVALADLEDAVQSAARHSAAAGESLRESIHSAVDALAQFPEMGAIYERDRTGRTREILCRQYRLFYRIDADDTQIGILMVRHSARSDPRL